MTLYLELNAKQIIKEAIEKCSGGGYSDDNVVNGIESIGIAFNGGKDSTVMLHIITSMYPEHPFPVYYHLDVDDTFEEEMEFVLERIPILYPKLVVSVHRTDGNSTAALKDFLSKNPFIKLMMIGLRASDTTSDVAMQEFMETEDPYPAGIIRCHPLLSFSYRNIWTYIDWYGLEYCSLYDKGFSSIGAKSTTKPNPSLISNNTTTIPNYKGARFLVKEEDERLGRI